MSQPVTLSIIIPAYNEESHISLCLDSIQEQTVKPHEIIVVDNNSSDQTARVASSYPSVKVISEKKQGVVFARNTGFNEATGQIIGRIDADSILPPDWVEKITAYYSEEAHSQQAFTGGGHFYNVPLPNVSSWIQDQIAFRMNRLLLGHYILYGSNMALPAVIWKKVQQDICLRHDIHEDLDLAIHVHRAGYTIDYHAGVQVGVKMRRVFQNHSQLWANMMMWPQTLKVHKNRRWIFGWLGGFLLYIFTPLLYPAKLLQLMHMRLRRFRS